MVGVESVSSDGRIGVALIDFILCVGEVGRSQQGPRQGVTIFKGFTN